MENVLFVSISRANSSNVCAAGILKVFTRYGFVVSKRELSITLTRKALLIFDKFLQNHKCEEKLTDTPIFDV